MLETLLQDLGVGPNNVDKFLIGASVAVVLFVFYSFFGGNDD